MSFLELLVILSIVCFVLFLFISARIDCNLSLWLKDLYGAPVSTLRGQVIWITGASSGIGRALAIELAGQGARLVLSARRKQKLEEVKAICLEQAHGSLNDKDVLVLPMDVLEMETHEAHFRKVLDNFGQLNVLVNNAGRSQRANWECIDVQVDRALFELDVFAVLNLSRIVLRYFLKHTGGRGHIACTSSVAGISAVPFSATYVAAKFALNAYMMTLQVEHPETNVTVFAPGPVETDFLREAFTDKLNGKVDHSLQNQKRMTAKRCGHLFAVALANKIKFTWCGHFPVNFLVYISRDPILSELAYSKGRVIINKIREGKF